MTIPFGMPLAPWQAYGLHQTGGTHLRFHLQGSEWTSSWVLPAVTINGGRVPVTYGLNILPVYPGRNVIEAQITWMRQYGQASFTVDLGPGQSTDVWYTAPLTQFHVGSMGPVKQRRKGVLALTLWASIILAVCVVLPISVLVFAS